VSSHGALVGVQQLATFAGFRVGHPDTRGVASQIDPHDARCRHLVVVGVALGALADVAAFQHHGAQPQGQQPPVDLKAVGARFQKEEVLARKFLRHPIQQAFQTELVALAKLSRVVRSGTLEDGCRIGLRVAVQADDPPVDGRFGSGVNLRSSPSRFFQRNAFF
jgi:hypothetical protein